MSLNLGDFNPVRILAGKGEIGKSGLGSALATLALDYFAPGLGSSITGLEGAAGTAALVGGGTALASGSLQKGLMAGIGAYGTSELLGGAESGITDAAAERLQGSESFAKNFADQIGLSRADLAAPATPLSMGEQFKAGLSGLKAMPTKDLLQYGAMAAAPVLMAQSQKGMPSSTTNPNAYIRPKAYDPATHRYYDLPAVKAGDWGSQSISDYVNSQVAPAQAARGGLMAAYANGGMAQDAAGGGMFNYAQMQPAVNLNPNSGVTPNNMAKGGYVKRYAGETDGSVVASSDTPSAEVTAAINAGRQGFAPGVSAQDVVSGFNLNQAQAAQVAQALGYTGNLGGLNYGAASSNPATYANAAAPSAGFNALQGAENALYPSQAPVYSNYSPTQMENFFTANPDVNIPDAIRQYNANPNAVNQYIAGVAKNYVDPTATQKGSGTLGIYQDLMKQGFSPTEFSAAEKGVNSKFGAAGDYWNQDTVAKAYQVADKVLQFDPLTDKVTPSDKEWVAFMDKNNISTKDISIATGLSQNEVNNRYNAVKASTPTTTPAPVTPTSKITDMGVVPGGTQLPNATTYDNGAYGNYGSGNKTGTDYLGRTTSIATPGDIITNPDQSRTVVSNAPGRPYGGFTGMDALTSAYTAGGGRLGQVLKPTQTYQNTGGSKAAYDYLNGLGTYAATKTQPDVKPKNTYSSFSAPSADEIKQFSKYPKVFRNGAVVDNPYYNKGNIIDSNGPVANLINQVSNDAGGGLADGGSANSLRTLLTGDAQNAYDKLDAKGLGSSKQAKQLKQELDYRARMKAYQQTPQVMPTVDQTDDQTSTPFAAGGQAHYNLGGYSDGGRLLRGPGDGVSDSIPATIGNKQPARLADGEFVVPARIVSEIGNGSTEAGARKLYAMMDRVQSARSKTVGKGKVAKNTRADKYLPA